ncbi:MAG: hypothetical protein JWM98_411 [Thermoleophilia bacterium]|nr:hypothetical protein [Thermoleophilia bacterium]
MNPRARTAVLLLSTSLALAACGGGSGGGGGSTDIPDVRDCLKDALKGASFQDTKPSDKDSKVRAGVFASTTPSASSKGSAAPAKDFVMALAADVKSKDTVKSFQHDSKSLATALSAGGAEKLQVESGVDGTYVWVVAGARGAAGFDDAKDCVKP